MDERWLRKGSRIRARWLASALFGSWSLPGCQPKAVIEEVVITGTVCHVRGDRPTAPTTVRLYVEPEGDVPAWLPRLRPYGCECPGHDRLVEVDPENVVEVSDG